MLKKYESYKKEEYDDNFILSLLHLDDCEIRFNLIEVSHDIYYFYKNDWLYYIARYNHEKHMITFNNQIIINKLNMDYIDKMETLKKIMIKYTQFNSIRTASCFISDNTINRLLIS